MALEMALDVRFQASRRGVQVWWRLARNAPAPVRFGFVATIGDAPLFGGCPRNPGNSSFGSED